MDSKNESDDSDDEFESRDLYDWGSDSDNLDLISKKCILLKFK